MTFLSKNRASKRKNLTDEEKILKLRKSFVCQSVLCRIGVAMLAIEIFALAALAFIFFY